METINVICLSPQAEFFSNLQELFAPFRQFLVYQVSSPEKHPPVEIGDALAVLVVDVDSLSGKLQQTVNEITKSYTDCPLVLISEKGESLRVPATWEAFLFDWQTIQGKLFPPFIELLKSQKELVQNYTETQANLSKRITELDLIRKASLHLTMNLSLDSVLESILDSAMQLVSADDTHIFLYESGVLHFASALFGGTQQKEPYMHPRQDGVTYHVAREGVKKVVPNMMEDQLFSGDKWEGAIISLPLKIGQKVLGVMNVALHHPHHFSEGEIRVLEFLGDQAAIAIQNAKLYEQAQQEIAVRKKAEKAIQHLANHDALTGLPNRRLFNERIRLEIVRSKRNGHRFSVMLFDLDQLKDVNDLYGHNIGDMLLQSISQRLLGVLRQSDTIARMGGDEFLLILPEMNQPQDAILTAERILSVLITPFHLETNQINITASIGIANFPEDGEEVDILIKNADNAMYQAKQRGGNTYHLHTS